MLTGKQRAYLRGQGNDLQAIVQIGKEGTTDSQLTQVDQALEDHELIKVRVLDNSSLDTREVASQIASDCDAEVIQVIGGVFILYRRNQEEPIYNIPD